MRAMSEASITTPLKRIRISHDLLAKEGWRYDTTVEIAYGPETSDRDAQVWIEEATRQAGVTGKLERDRRNREDGRDGGA
jgi:hypothetical protein